MITKENAIPGTEVMYGDHQTVIEPGSYDDPELGFMLKTARFPGGYPAKEFRFIDSNKAEQAEIITEPAIPAVTFEVAILDKPEPVKITAALIREESKVLTDLTIANYLDEKGYEAVKKAKLKAVKTRTAIEKKEAEVIKKIKTRHISELKQVTDYTAELYVACREIEKDLGDKLTKVDNEKAAEALRLTNAEKERTEGRETKLFELGLLWNGQAFVGLGRQYAKNSIHSLGNEAWEALVVELEGLQLEQSVTGEVKPEPFTGSTIGVSAPMTARFNIGKDPFTTKREYPTAIYDKTLPGGTRIILTQGIVEYPEAGAQVVNDRVKQSNIYVQII